MCAGSRNGGEDVKESGMLIEGGEAREKKNCTVCTFENGVKRLHMCA